MMDSMLLEITEIETALSKIEYSDLYSAGLELFQAMDYPVKPLDIAINININQFIFFKLEKEMQFSQNEFSCLKSVKTISVLFFIENDREIGKDRNLNRIVFIAVDLFCSMSSRSQYASSITQIINKAYNCPVFILFRYDNSIVFSGMVYNEIKEVLDGQVILSDWYSCKGNNYEQLITLHKLSFAYHAEDNIAELYYDMLYSIARKYITHPESYEYVAFDSFRFKYSDENLIYQEIDFEEIKEKAKESFLYYQRFYGDDYTDDEEKLELLLPEDEEWIFEELEGFTIEDEYTDKDDENFDGEELISKDEYYLPEGFDEEYFKDPVKMLEWFDKT